MTADRLDENLFEAPRERAQASVAAVDGDPYALRQAHRDHERALRGVGSLLFGAGLFVGLYGVLLAALFAVALFAEPPDDAVAMVLAGLFLEGICGYLVISSALVARAGARLERLERGGANGFYVLAVFLLFNPPFGSIIGTYLLWLLLSDRGKFVLSPRYADAVEATPQLQPPRLFWVSLLNWLLLLGGLLTLLVLLLALLGLALE